jgi:myo-inositol-1(or 4)-monophosphatase
LLCVADLLDELLSLGAQLASDAAALLIDGLGRTRAEVATKTSITDMVTEIDRASEDFIVKGIRRARPHDAIVGEEGADVAGTSGVRWLIDPVDGTTNYLYGFPGFAVSIAAQIDGDTIIGVVHDPMHRDVFTAARGRGARRNGELIRVSDKGDLPTALVATGFGYDRQRRREQAAVLLEVLPQVRDIRRMGAAAVDLCSVACGRVDAYYEWGLAPWDLAAGVLVAQEAGAVAGDLHGGPPSGEFTLIAPIGLFDQLREMLLAARARSGLTSTIRGNIVTER